MSSATLYVGDVREVLATLPENSIDLVVTSPPFLALRSYLPMDHPDKAKEIGGEPNPGEFIDALLDVVEACDRVLTPHGSICIELGDTYSGKQGVKVQGWPDTKCLTLIPELFRLSLAYGRNPLTDRETSRWKVRNVVRWYRPNPPVGALGDKFRPATSDMVIACKSRTRYFDLDAVREPAKHPKAVHYVGNVSPTRGDHGDPGKKIENHPGGVPPLDTWMFPTAPYKGSHYATFPPALVIKPILSMCPERVCRTCGEPSRRITETMHDVDEQKRRRAAGIVNGKDVHDRADNGGSTHFLSTVNLTIGWTDCGHDDWRPGVVLDPFAGTGTTLAVAIEHDRDAVGIDLDSRNVELVQRRVEGTVTVIEPSEPEELAA